MNELSPGFYIRDMNGNIVPVVDESAQIWEAARNTPTARAFDALNQSADRIAAAVVGDFFSFPGGLFEEALPNVNQVGRPNSLFDVANVIVNEVVEKASSIHFRPQPCDNGAIVNGVQLCPPNAQTWPADKLDGSDLYGKSFDLKPLSANVQAKPCDIWSINGQELSTMFQREFGRLTRLSSYVVARVLTSGSASGVGLGTDSPQFLAESTAQVLGGGIPASPVDALSRIASALSILYPGLTGTIYMPATVWGDIIAGGATSVEEVTPGRFTTKQGGHLIAIDAGFTGRAPGAVTDPALDDPILWLYATLGRPTVLLSPVSSPNLENTSISTIDFKGTAFPANAFGEDGTGRFNNTLRLFARRKFVVGIDPCTILAMPVDMAIPLYGLSSGGGGGGAAGFSAVNGYDTSTATVSLNAGAYSVAGTNTTRTIGIGIVGPDSVDHWEVYSSLGRKFRYGPAATQFTLAWAGVANGEYQVITRAVMRSGKSLEVSDSVVVATGNPSWANAEVSVPETYPVTVAAVARVFNGATGLYTSTIPALTGQFQLDRIAYDESDDPFIGGGSTSSSPTSSAAGIGFIEATVDDLPGWAILKASAVAPYSISSFDFYNQSLALVPLPNSRRIGRTYKESIVTYRLDGSVAGVASGHEPGSTILALTNIVVGNELTLTGNAGLKLMSWAYRWTYDTGNGAGDTLIINGDPNLDNVPRTGLAGYGEPGWQHSVSSNSDLGLTGVNHFLVTGNARIEIKATFRILEG